MAYFAEATHMYATRTYFYYIEPRTLKKSKQGRYVMNRLQTCGPDGHSVVKEVLHRKHLLQICPGGDQWKEINLRPQELCHKIPRSFFPFLELGNIFLIQ